MEEQAVGHVSDRMDVFGDDPVSVVQVDFPVQVADYVHVELVAVFRKLVAVSVRQPLSSRDAAAARAILELVHGQ